MLSSIWLVLFSSTFVVFVTYVTPTNSSDPYIEHLKQLIREQEELKNLLTAEVTSAKDVMEIVFMDYRLKILSLGVAKLATSEDAKKKVKEVKKVFYNLTQLLNEEQELNQTLGRLQFTRNKQDVALEWLAEDIILLKSRNGTGDDIQCSKYEKEILSRRNSQLSIKTMILKDELRELQAGNSDVALLIDNIMEEIRMRAQLYEDRIQELKVLISSYKENINKTEGDIKQIGADSEIVKTNIRNLITDINNEQELIKKNKKEAIETKFTLLKFSKAAKCYKNVVEDILRKY